MNLSALIYATSGSLYQRALVHPDFHNFAPLVWPATFNTTGTAVPGETPGGTTALTW